LGHPVVHFGGGHKRLEECTDEINTIQNQKLKANHKFKDNELKYGTGLKEFRNLTVLDFEVLNSYTAGLITKFATG